MINNSVLVTSYSKSACCNKNNELLFSNCNNDCVIDLAICDNIDIPSRDNLDENLWSEWFKNSVNPFW